jgi:hypothetical protein
MEESDALFHVVILGVASTHGIRNSVLVMRERSAGQISQVSVDFTIPVLMRAAWAIVIATHTASGDVCFGETLSGCCGCGKVSCCDTGCCQHAWHQEQRSCYEGKECWTFTIPVLMRAAWAIVIATHTASGDVCFGETLSGSWVLPARMASGTAFLL